MASVTAFPDPARHGAVCNGSWLSEHGSHHPIRAPVIQAALCRAVLHLISACGQGEQWKTKMQCFEAAVSCMCHGGNIFFKNGLYDKRPAARRTIVNRTMKESLVEGDECMEA